MMSITRPSFVPIPLHARHICRSYLLLSWLLVLLLLVVVVVVEQKQA